MDFEESTRGMGYGAVKDNYTSFLESHILSFLNLEARALGMCFNVIKSLILGQQLKNDSATMQQNNTVGDRLTNIIRSKTMFAIRIVR
ncbi:hypothetical protein TNCV_2085841 [Trichonephila clavipes]|nr:hypothetical protein TNCV_2085841 [Trichonephila clavipes]